MTAKNRLDTISVAERARRKRIKTVKMGINRKEQITTGDLTEGELKQRLVENLLLVFKDKGYLVNFLTEEDLVSGPDGTKLYFRHPQVVVDDKGKPGTSVSSELFSYTYKTSRIYNPRPLSLFTLTKWVFEDTTAFFRKCFLSIKCEERPVYINGLINVYKKAGKRAHEVYVKFDFGIPGLGGVVK